MIQVIHEVLNNPEDKTKLSLVFGNVRDFSEEGFPPSTCAWSSDMGPIVSDWQIEERDIVCRDLLDGWQKKFPDQFRVHYMLDKPAPGWDGGKGIVLCIPSMS